MSLQDDVRAVLRDNGFDNSWVTDNLASEIASVFPYHAPAGIDGELAQRAFEAGYNAFFAADNGYRAPELLLESALHAIINTFFAAITGKDMPDE